MFKPQTLPASPSSGEGFSRFSPMKLIAQIKLTPSAEQHVAMMETTERANTVCNAIIQAAWDEKKFRQYDLHKLTYHKTKKDFGLTAQVAVRCIAKVA
jgi:putative transposase